MKNEKRKIQKNRKLVVVGNGMTGKTCLLYAFKDDNFVSSHQTTIFETYTTEIELEGKTIIMSLFDTPSQDNFARLRPLAYPDTNVVLICFSIDCPTSTMNVIQQWNPEVRHYCDSSPVILVACKIDLRKVTQTNENYKQQNKTLISTEDGQQLAAQIEADAYMECSAKTREGINDLFIHATRLSLAKQSCLETSRKCFLF